jgi:hypothetical protein
VVVEAVHAGTDSDCPARNWGRSHVAAAHQSPVTTLAVRLQLARRSRGRGMFMYS